MLQWNYTIGEKDISFKTDTWRKLKSNDKRSDKTIKNRTKN